MNKKYFVLIMLALASLVACKTDPSGLTVIFPKVNGPVQVTDSTKEHFFASYFGINSWSKSERYITVLETDIRHTLPTENEPATLGLVDLQTKKFIPLTQTRAWNFQQGCMAHWLATSPDSLIIFNDLREGKFVSVIMNVHTKKEIRVIPYPVGAVSPNGKEAACINFSRMRLLRPDYGYGGNGQDARADVQFPEDDGIFLVNLETGKAKLVISIAQIKNMVPEAPQGEIEYFNHILFSRGGTKIFWLARVAPPVWNTTSFTANIDGSNIQRCFPDKWGGSHFDWLTDDDLMITAEYEGKQYAHILFTVGKQNYKRLGGGLLDYDGHGTFSPDGKWMVTDTYAKGGMGEQKIYLLDMKTQAVLSLGRYREPEEFSGQWRCDIHCRWSPEGDMIGFNSTHSGSRQVYIFKLQE